MAERINNIMKNNALLRAILYFFIAALPALITDLGQFRSFGEISQVTAVIIMANFILQGIIAVRAFLDQSISRNSDKKNNKVELING
jgi:hypothetical protein